MALIVVSTKSAVSLAGAQTLSNKTITSPIINSILTAAADAATLTLVARNTAAQTQTVLTVVGAATVANSYITAQVGGTWTLASGQTWTIPGFTSNAQSKFTADVLHDGHIIFATADKGIYSSTSDTNILSLMARNTLGAAQEGARLISAVTITNAILATYAQAAAPTTDGAGNTAILPAGYSWIKYNASGTLVAYVNDAGTIKSLSLGTPT